MKRTNGCIRPLGGNRFRLIFDMEPVLDEVTGKSKRRQKWVTFEATNAKTERDARRQAEAKMRDLLGSQDKGTFVEPSKLILIAYLRDWVEIAAKPPLRRPETYRVYKSMIKHVAKSAIGQLPLQKVRASHLERLYADSPLSASSQSVFHAVLNRALRNAVKERLIVFNPAAEVENRQRPSKKAASRRAEESCWTAEEARWVLEAAAKTKPQMAAFVFLAFDTGARKSELHGLTWPDIDLDAGTVRIHRQLDEAGTKPVFGPLKADSGTRTLSLGPETVARLRAHRKAQAELKIRNRTVYEDFALVFAKEQEDLITRDAQLGQPLDRLSEWRFRKLLESAGVRRIKFHAVRHTVATLLLGAGEGVHVVAERLGHADPTMTLRVYAHVLKDQSASATARLRAILHG